MELYLGLGSNLGDRKENLLKALDLFSCKLGSAPLRVSSFIETDPVGFDSPNRFLNAVAVFDCECREDTAEDMAWKILGYAKETELLSGRAEHMIIDDSGKRIYADRQVDMDILLFGGLRMDCERLKIPHPLMKSRDFVMIPLMEVISDEMKEMFL